jgi:hypothetical protein
MEMDMMCGICIASRRFKLPTIILAVKFITLNSVQVVHSVRTCTLFIEY